MIYTILAFRTYSDGRRTGIQKYIRAAQGQCPILAFRMQFDREMKYSSVVAKIAKNQSIQA